MLYAVNDGVAAEPEIVIFPVLVRTNVLVPVPFPRNVPLLVRRTVPEIEAAPEAPFT
jgi:hypothetical protein